MPFIRVTSFPQSKEVRSEIADGITEVVHRATSEIADGITEVVHRATKIPKDSIWVVFEPMPSDSWSVGGALVSDKK